jgi:hypothetical protein
MPKDIIITPDTALIDFKNSSNVTTGSIQLDDVGNLNVTSPGGNVVLGNPNTDIYIGDGTNNIDLVFEQDGEIRGLTGKTITFGQADSYVSFGAPIFGNTTYAAGGVDSTKNITLRGSSATNGTLSWEGSEGQLFSITNNLSSGSIYSVNDISGIPALDINADGTVSIGAYYGNVGIGTELPTAKLDVVGSIKVNGSISSPSSVLIGSASPTGTASQNLQVFGGAYVSGNLGVGVTNPVSKLDVLGNVNVSGNVVITGTSIGMGNDTAILFFNDSTDQTRFGYWSNKDGFEVRGDSNTKSNVVLQTGNLEIEQSAYINGRLGIGGGLSVSGISTFNQIIETSRGRLFDGIGGGTLNIDISLGTVVLGYLTSNVTLWNFTNFSTENGKSTTVDVIISGLSGPTYTYGDLCSVNGSPVLNGVRWVGGSAPTPTANVDLLTFRIIRDTSGDLIVLGIGNTNFS